MRKVSVALLLGASLLAQDSQPPSPTPAISGKADQGKPTPEQQKIDSDKKKAAEAFSALVNQVVSEIARRDRQKQGDKGKESLSVKSGIPDLLVAFFPGVLAIAAVIQIFVYFRQANYMKRGVRLSIAQSRIANKSAIAAKIAADAAMTSAHTSQRALTVLERADVSIQGLRTEGAVSAMSIIVASVKNHGRTRAKNVSARLILATSPSIVGGTPSVVLTETHYPFTIGAGEEKRIQFNPANLTQRMEEQINGGYVQLTANLSVSYADEFGSYAWMAEGHFRPHGDGHFIIIATM